MGKRKPARRPIVRPRFLVLLFFAVALGLNWCHFSSQPPEPLPVRPGETEPLVVRQESQRPPPLVAKKSITPGHSAADSEITGTGPVAAATVVSQADDRSEPPGLTETQPPVDSTVESSELPASKGADPVSALDDLSPAITKQLSWIQQATELVTGHAEGRFVQSVNSSKGVYSDRSYTVYETTLELSGAEGIGAFALRWRGRYAPSEDLSEDIPTNYLEEAWYSWGDPAGPYRLTLGRHYIDSADGELVDGISINQTADKEFSLGAFAGFRPNPYDFSFRADAISAGVYSSWTDKSSGRSYSRQALVINIFKQAIDRAYFSWDSSKGITDTLSLRQYLTMDYRPDDGGLNLTNYSLGLDWQPSRDLWVNWRGETYRGIFYDVGSEDIPTDTSPVSSSSVSVRYVVSKKLINSASLRYSRRDKDQSLSWSLGADFPDLLESGATLSLLYSATDYYNAFFDSYSMTLTRTFLEKMIANLGLRYWRNSTDQPRGSSSADYSAVSGGVTYLLNDRINFSAYYEFQQSRFENGSTLGRGFDPASDPTSVTDRANGHNFSLILEYRF